MVLLWVRAGSVPVMPRPSGCSDYAKRVLLPLAQSEPESDPFRVLVPG